MGVAWTRSYMWKFKGVCGFSFPVLQENQIVIPCILQASHHLPFRLVIAAKSMKNEAWRKAQDYVKWWASSLRWAGFTDISCVTAAGWGEPDFERHRVQGIVSQGYMLLSTKTSGMKELLSMHSCPRGVKRLCRWGHLDKVPVCSTCEHNAAGPATPRSQPQERPMGRESWHCWSPGSIRDRNCPAGRKMPVLLARVTRPVARRGSSQPGFDAANANTAAALGSVSEQGFHKD